MTRVASCCRKAAITLLVVFAFVVAAHLQDSTAFADTPLQAGNAALQAAESTKAGTFETYAGSDRYDVARRVAEAERALPSASCKGVIVCSCNEGKFPDALSAAGLSGILNYPILAVNGISLTVFDRAALDEMKAACPSGSLDIIVVGGTATITPAAEYALGMYGKVTQRFAGADRYEVNRLVYEYGAAHGGWAASQAFVARGDNFPDALTIAPFLVSKKCPIALIDPSSTQLPAHAREIVSKADQAVILGGESSVSEKALKDAQSAAKGKSALRLGGADRYEASANIVRWELEHGMTLQGAGVATGERFPDALSSSYLLGHAGSVLMLTSPSGTNASMMRAVKSAAASAQPSLLRVFGGSASVPDAIYSQVADAVGWTSHNTKAQGKAMQSKAAYTRCATQCSQMIIVEAWGTSANVSLHQKNGAGAWEEVMSAPGYVGWGGVGRASEGSSVTPAGSFDIPFAFGNAGNPGTSLLWYHTTWESTWVDDPDSPYYNTWQESSDLPGEPLRGIGWLYDYALVIGYNYPRYCTIRDPQTVSWGGSAFFIHCSEDKPTAGCVTIPYDDMRRLVQLTRAGCRVVIGDSDTIYTY